MGGVAVLHSQDVLRDRLGYNRMPLVSRDPNFIQNYETTPKGFPNPNLKSGSNSNRRKRSPQKKNNDVSRSPLSKSSNFNGLRRATEKGVVGDLRRGKISSAHKLEMGKVKILKRGEALTSDVKAETKKASVDEVKNDVKDVYDDKKTKKVSFDEVKTEAKVVIDDKRTKKVSFDEVKNDAKVLNDDKKTKKVSFDEVENDAKVVNDDNKTKKVSFDEVKNDAKDVNDDKKTKVSFHEVKNDGNDDKKVNDLESIEMMLMRLGPEPEMVPRQIRLADFYAGSAFVASPDPSSVPVPDFFKKKSQEVDPSSHLRMLLNLAF